MSDEKFYDVWPPEGITDLPDNWSELAVPAIRDIVPVWHAARQKLAPQDLANFNERLAREWAIETGVIEGIYYIDDSATKTWILQGIEASLLPHNSTDKPVEFVADLVRDHLEALDWIQAEFVQAQHPLSRSRLWQLHSLLTRHQEWVDALDANMRPIKVPLVKGRWKDNPNSVFKNGIQYSYCLPHRVDDQMNVLMEMHHRHVKNGVPPEIQAAWLHHRLTQIHPFHDGNGRIARAVASFIFIKAGLFPLVINRDQNFRQYIDALRAADDGDLGPLVNVLAQAQLLRFDRALNIADDLAAPAKTLESAIANFKAKRSERAEEVATAQQTVFKIADGLRRVATQRLTTVVDMLKPINSTVTESDVNTNHYYRGQIIEAARGFQYYANTTVYSSWVKLIVHGEKDGGAAQLLLSFHGRGSEFAGAMVCAPVFELIYRTMSDVDSSDRVPNERKQIEVTDRPFEFYFTESLEQIEPRFRVWLDETLTLALSQLQRID
jgi:Fic family protein